MVEQKNGAFQIPPMSCTQMVEYKDEMIASLKDQEHIAKIALPLTDDLINLTFSEKGSPYYIVKQATAIAAVELEFAKRYTEQYQIEHSQNPIKK